MDTDADKMCPALDTPIIDSIDKTLFDKPLPAVTDRYFEHKYCMKIDEELQEVHQRISFHTNKICMISLAENHPVIKEKLAVKSINWKISETVDRSKNAVSGKGKKGAQKLEPKSVLCFVECEGGASFPVYSCIKGKLLEINETLMAEPELVASLPKSDGFVALLLPVLSMFKDVKESMLTYEEYVVL